MEITIGQVSGVIAAIVFVVQHIYPNALILILVGALRNQHTALTWSVVQRQLFGTLWPTILRSDTAAGNGVNTNVRLISLLRPLGLGLVAIAAVVTPLGLHDAIVPSSSTQAVPFLYLQDNGPMGMGTPAQNNSIAFTRECTFGLEGLIACPGSSNTVIIDTDESGEAIGYDVIGTYDMDVPQSSQELYESGLKNFDETVSSFFDIRARQYTTRTGRGLNDGKPYIVDTFRMLQSMVLNNDLEPVQGLVVDTVNGGIGFRNHTVPLNIGQGAEWSEDLLFIEPMTECVNTNLTFEFMIGDGKGLSASAVANLTLVDNGGFANLIQDYPHLNMDDNQSNPKLRERAYKAAWLTNVYNMLILNVTRPNPHSFAYLNSEVGERFPLVDYANSVASAQGVLTDSLFSSVLDASSNTIQTHNNSFTNQTETTGLYTNPFNITEGNFTDVSILCQGVGGQDYANSSNIAVQCGLFYGAAKRKDGVESLIFEPNTTWVQPIYTCASTNKALIKTVSFRYNATMGSDLKSLTITSITDKTYEKEEDMPLWAIEQPDPPITLSGISQFWGLIAEENANTANVSSKRAPELYLPGFSLASDAGPGMPGYEYMPAATIPLKALGTMYSIGTGGSTSSGFIADYSGASNLNMFKRWQDLSANETTIPQILHLVWTDVMANGVQGTRGWGSPNSQSNQRLIKRDGTSSRGQTLVPVRVYNKRIQYHLIYAIPAVIALTVFLIVLLGATCTAIFRNGPKRIKHYMQHLSAGRILAAEQYPGQSLKTAPTKLWTVQVGKHMVSIVDPQGMQGRTEYTGSRQNYMMYAEKRDGAVTTSVESYPMGPMNMNAGRAPQGYMPVEGHENNIPRRGR